MVRKLVITDSDLFKDPSLTYDSDDIFCDECTLGDESAYGDRFPQFVTFLHDRSQLKNGSRTVAVVSGHSWPNDILVVEQLLVKKKLTDYVHLKLQTTVRGTKAIIDAWASDFENPSAVRIGHSIGGYEVDQPHGLVTKEQVFDCILRKIGIFRKASDLSIHPSNDRGHFSLRHVAIIAEHEKTAKEVKIFLADNHIACGTAEEQLKDNNVIALMSGYGTILSHEWAVVIVVILQSFHNSTSFFLLAASRAMAHLTIIARDYMVIQRSIDKRLQEAVNRGSATFWLFFIVVIAESSATDRYLITSDLSCAMLRNNCLPAIHDAQHHEKDAKIQHSMTITAFIKDYLLCNNSLCKYLQPSDIACMWGVRGQHTHCTWTRRVGGWGLTDQINFSVGTTSKFFWPYCL